MEEVLLSKEKNIKDLIYEIRGNQVMLDRDLARLYHVETKVFIQSVKRNIERFPDNFMFQLTKDEFLYWRSQIVTSKSDNIGLRRPPYAFTEQGVAMLSGILRSDIAVNTSIMIMNAFVSMRHYLIDNKDVYKSINNINNKLVEHDEKLELIFSRFDKANEYLYLSGQVYDAYSKVLDIFEESKSELIIVDGYADKNLLDIIKELKVKVIIITKKDNLLSKNLIDKYNEQYSNLKVIYDDTFHDRYFIIDKDVIYHCGASINKLGYRTFSINKIEDEIIKKTLLNSIDNLM